MTSELEIKKACNETIARLAKETLEVSNACNLSGVIYSWSKIIEVLWSVATQTGEGSSWVNHHPINKAFADKVFELSGSSMSDTSHWTALSKMAEAGK